MNGGGLARAAAPAVVALALAAILSTPPPQPETFSNIPQTLSGGDGKQQVRIKRPKSAKALQCTSKCVATCIRGGEGPLNASGSFQGTIPQPAVLLGRVLGCMQSHQGWRRWAMRKALTRRSSSNSNQGKAWIQGWLLTEFYTRN
ncbi:uncharacterized protein LOC127777487 isoform X1 [Oryza glaberrima]|uniref:uncharacterized protein LOC127777487 isoform X1 n=1 Tax=Oryza glaberrima TaxID=4538 RepID=UPI00224C4CFC|nr:uncharacterized protein LOC127777487 isoform X1 [Oryza glaberrima]